MVGWDRISYSNRKYWKIARHKKKVTNPEDESIGQNVAIVNTFEFK